ncbi:MAG: hypothetical protein GY869_22140, partial [Planctomycetes bacterium]|nr:hypothetical protein [Planctomycetota bacterium]
ALYAEKSNWNNLVNIPAGFADGIDNTGSGDITAVNTTGSGLTGGGTSGSVTLAHADTSIQVPVNNSNGMVVQDIGLDGYGHLTSVISYNLDNRYCTKSVLQTSGGNEVHWGSLSNIPPGFADGVDNVGGTDNDWTVNGSNMYSAVSGNVGIGTTSPDFDLDIFGAQGFRVIKDGGADSTFTFGDFGETTWKYGTYEFARIDADGGPAGYMQLSYQNNPKIKLHSNSASYLNGGNVGIGTTNPLAKMHVVQSSTADAFRVDDYVGDTTPFVIDSSGYVGIGRTSPTQPLDVNGTIEAHGLSSTSHLSIKSDGDIEFTIDVDNDDPSTAFFDLFNGAGEGLFHVNENGYTTMQGKAAIGASPSPSCQLNVVTDTETTYAGYFDNNDNVGLAYGVLGRAIGAGGSNHYGIYGTASGATTNWAGFFAGDVYISGNLSKGGGTFKIDHPLDPENKILSHSFVESPDMKNVYDGVVQLDQKGEAIVKLPEYFEALNRDFRYQLTSIGGPGPNLYIAKEISDNMFVIAGGQPELKVSWQITGIRKDPYAEANPINVEEDKPPQERGLYLHPEAYGKRPDAGIQSLHEIKESKKVPK